MRAVPDNEDPRLGTDVSDKAISAAAKDKPKTGLEMATKPYPAMTGEDAAVEAGLLEPRGKNIRQRLVDFRESEEQRKLKELEAVLEKDSVTDTHVPSEASRAIVSELLFVNPVERVAKILCISENTLRKYYEFEIEEGGALQMGALANSAIRRAQAGDTTLTIFLLKTKGGMRERPIEKEIEDKAKNMTPDDRKALLTKVLMAFDATEKK